MLILCWALHACMGERGSNGVHAWRSNHGCLQALHSVHPHETPPWHAGRLATSLRGTH